MRKLAVIALPCMTLLAIAAFAQPASGSSAAASLSQLSWLSGVWRGEGLGGQVEDVYQPLNHGEILSTMKLVANGAVTRYELRSIHEERGAIIIQELAYGPGLRPADPVPTRPLLFADADHARFEGLTLTRTGKNAMRADVTIGPPGQRRTVTIEYSRVLQFSEAVR